MVEQNMMTITDLCDDLLGVISNRVLEIKRDRAAKTIARAWRGSLAGRFYCESYSAPRLGAALVRPEKPGNKFEAFFGRRPKG